MYFIKQRLDFYRQLHIFNIQSSDFHRKTIDFDTQSIDFNIEYEIVCFIKSDDFIFEYIDFLSTIDGFL